MPVAACDMARGGSEAFGDPPDYPLGFTRMDGAHVHRGVADPLQPMNLSLSHMERCSICKDRKCK
ncbi:hypothetical protein, partial [Hyphomonas pacifica]|uniref:hypothetical protein n=1 Tax=Hyphomonas pacifica TaxID=1280941 RepID=UPI0019D7065E